MKKLQTLLLFAIIISSCQHKSEIQSDLKPTYINFDTAWEEQNLFGKVKTLDEYKVVYQKTKGSEKAITTLKEEYTDFGQLKSVRYFDNSGEVTQYDQYFYNSQKYRNRTISINKIAEQKVHQLTSYDTINNITTNKVIINDSIDIKLISYLNEKDFITKQLRIENQDTILNSITYQYNTQDQLISERNIKHDNSQNNFTNQYTYNKEGNLIEFSNKSEWLELKTETEWEHDKISKQTHYTIAADLKEHLDEITEYDILYNPTNKKYYKNSELNRELKYTYEFDENGNWTKRLVSLKEHTIHSDTFTPIYVETRDITYW